MAAVIRRVRWRRILVLLLAAVAGWTLNDGVWYASVCFLICAAAMWTDD